MALREDFSFGVLNRSVSVNHISSFYLVLTLVRTRDLETHPILEEVTREPGYQSSVGLRGDYGNGTQPHIYLFENF